MKAISLLPLVAAALAEQLSFDPSDYPAIYPVRETFRRSLVDAECGFQGNKLVCAHGFEIETGNGGVVVVRFSVRCDADSQIRFNYQKAANCQCSATVTTPDGLPPKTCPCTVCQSAFGEVPVSVDCTQYEGDYLSATDTSNVISTARSGGSTPVGNITAIEPTPFIVGTCTSLDCGAACNGTCHVNCANSGTTCSYCAAQNQPTTAPTGSGAPTDYGTTMRPVVASPTITFSAPAGQTIVCTDSLDNVCTAPHECSTNGQSGTISGP